MRLIYLASALATLICLVYLATPSLMPYHEEFLGVDSSALPHKERILLLVFLKLGAAFGLLMQVAVVLLARGPLRDGDRFAWWLIVLLGFVPLGLLFAVSLYIGLHTPWWAAGLIWLTMGAGLARTRC